MAELSHRERLQPSLFDRLIDEEPERQHEYVEKRGMSVAQLRKCVCRDLASLFNTTHMAAHRDLKSFPSVEHSVLNFGIPDLAGQTSGGVDVERLEAEIRQAILDFEPRLLSDELNVRLIKEANTMDHNALTFVIEGKLWCQPLPVHLRLRTDVDLENGTVQVEDRTEED